MESRLLKDFELHHKNPSLEALRRWRSAVALVKNRRRRFRMVADLDKRSEAEQIKQGIKDDCYSFPPTSISWISWSYGEGFFTLGKRTKLRCSNLISSLGIWEY
ncbi:putative calcium-transporting ATPase 11, plasma membrane-type [Cajanus cajan]|uniref:putative calcium-transporting ATPase 11, plasma membrane-type n=1 Tax=Cajanus cajan TaxID=3821 RepID=UPI00098D8F65|nr:putative calcium-transporting ATPase 11, plasma membrane-type [Cajanus cajan]